MEDPAKAVTFWGTYDSDKPRVRLLRDGLVDCGYAVEEINVDVWSGVRDKSQVKGVGSRLRIVWRLARAYPALLFRLMRSRSKGVVVVPYLGQLDILVVWAFAKLLGRKLVLDIFISLYDTLVFDRQLVGAGSLLARAIWRLERTAITCADVSLIDTAAHARRLERLFGFQEQRLGHVFVGVEEALFAPMERRIVSGEGGPLRVLFYGQMSPLHGIDTILQAVQRTKPGAVALTIIGTGQEDTLVEATLKGMDQPPTWLKWAPYETLRRHIIGADVCLGVFGESDKAASVIPNKVFQIASVGRHIVTRDGPGVRELFPPDDPGITLVPPADAQTLAEVLTRLASRVDELRSEVFHSEVRSRIARRSIGRDFAQQIERCSKEPAPS